MPIRPTRRFFKKQALKLAIGLPLAAVLGYYAFIASDRYVCEFALAVKDGGEGERPALTLLAGSNRDDVAILREHLRSRDLYETLEREAGLAKAWEAQQADWLARLSPSASREDRVDYLRRRIGTAVDDASGVLTVRVEAFTAADALRIGDTIAREAEQYMNGLSRRMLVDQVEFAEQAALAARSNQTQALARLAEFHSQSGTSDATAAARAAATLEATLAGQIAQLEAEYRAMTSFVASDAPQARALRARIDGLRSEAARQARPGSRAAQSARQHQLETEAAVADAEMKAAVGALEKARADRLKKAKHVIRVTEPRLPEAAQRPRRLYNSCVAILTALLLYGVARLASATIRDQRGYRS